MSKILSVISRKLKMSRDPDHIPSGKSITYVLVLVNISLHTKFELSTVGGQKCVIITPVAQAVECYMAYY